MAPPRTRTPTHLGCVVRSAREQLDMSRAELAVKLGLGEMTIIAWENGYRTPTLPMLYRIADALHIRPADLVDPR